MFVYELIGSTSKIFAMEKLKRLVIIIAIFTNIISLSAKTYNVSTSNFTFSPATTTIEVGDSVNFQLSQAHNAVQISKSTWDANGTTSNNGFKVPYGGGIIAFTKVDTAYYICQAHAAMGMKGTIIVKAKSTSAINNSSINEVKLFPNPAKEIVNLELFGNSNAVTVNFFDILGKLVQSSIINNPSAVAELSISNLKSGKYLVRIISNNTSITKTLVIQ